MFLRPTESPTVFLQQLGRGLRKYNDKKYLNVLDFIGNYKKADLMPFLLSGKSYTHNKLNKGLPNQEDYPEDCIVDFDFRLIDIFMIETTSMSKSYKMPILLAFYNDGDIKLGISEEDVY